MDLLPALLGTLPEELSQPWKTSDCCPPLFASEACTLSTTASRWPHAKSLNYPTSLGRGNNLKSKIMDLQQCRISMESRKLERE